MLCIRQYLQLNLKYYDSAEQIKFLNPEKQKSWLSIEKSLCPELLNFS